MAHAIGSGLSDASTCPQCGRDCEAEHRFCPGCGAPVATLRDKPDDPLIGCTLPGGHVVLELIDVGGMGRVYRAEQRMLGRTVAVKIIHPHLLGEETVEARFITEARAASQLNHPNSVGVIDFGKYEGRFYLVMQYLRGRDLATVAHREAPLEFDRIVDVLSQVLAALEEAHHLGIIHRDLKPENIVLESLRSGGDFVKVLDFGLAKVREAVHKRMGEPFKKITGPGMVCGTPEYMSPEQTRAGEIDHRADLYAVAVMLFELLTGVLPFDGDTPNDIALQHLSQLPPDPSTVSPRPIPAEFTALVSKGLSKDPADRFQSAREFSEALRRAHAAPELVRQRIRSGELLRCDVCEALVPRAQKFCGECGAQMRRRRTTPPGGTQPATMPGGVDGLPLPMVDREGALEWLFTKRLAAKHTVQTTRIVAPAGYGKSRLLTEFLREAERRDDLVFHVGADPWWAELGYYALRDLIAQLADLPAGGGTTADWSGANSEARTGMTELFMRRPDRPGSRGNRWSETPPEMAADSSRRLLVAEALSWALERAHARADGIVVVAFDDLHAIDGASRNAIRDLLTEPPPMGALLVGAHPTGFDPGWGDERFELQGIPTAMATLLIDGDEPAPVSRGAGALRRRATEEPRVPPMYVEQLIRFTAEGGGIPPESLADLIALRVERLDADVRRVLQAVAVLGDAAQVVQLVALLPDITDLSRGLGELTRTGFIQRDGGEVAITHPLLRDIVMACTPREVRRELHIRARRDFGVDDLQLPLEAHAVHAYHAAEPFEALMLLEQVAGRARHRGDTSGTVRALRMALDLARRELARGELDDPMTAVLIFSSKLGEALAQDGSFTDAEGVLREALDLAGPKAEARPRILAALAGVAYRAGDEDASDSHFVAALEAAEDEERFDLIDSLERMRASWLD